MGECTVSLKSMSLTRSIYTGTILHLNFLTNWAGIVVVKASFLKNFDLVHLLIWSSHF